MTETGLPITCDRLLSQSRHELLALYSSSEAGEIPDGISNGTAIAFAGTALAAPFAAVVRVLAWQGKVFDRASGRLRNRLTPFSVRMAPAAVYMGASRVDGQPSIILDYSRTSLLAWFVRDEIREVATGIYLGYAYGFGVRWLAFALNFNTKTEPS